MPHHPSNKTTWLLPVITLVLTAALAGLCVWQWLREARLTAGLREEMQRAAVAEQALEENRAQADRLRGENLRVTSQLEQETARLAETLEQLEIIRHDAAQLPQARAEAAELRERLEEAAQAITRANERIEEANKRILAHNETVAAANESITRLTRERDDAVRLLNQRTEQYNQLVRSIEESRRP